MRKTPPTLPLNELASPRATMLAQAPTHGHSLAVYGQNGTAITGEDRMSAADGCVGLVVR